MRVSTLDPPGAPGILMLADAADAVSLHPPRPILEADAQDPNSSPGPRVLVVDDDQELREAMRALLEDQGFLVIGEAADGDDAVAQTADLQPDVVLMDLRMPRLDGIKATHVIKGLLPLVQVVILSAYDDAGLVQGAENVGVYAYLVKGCPAQLIRDVLNAAAAFKGELVARQREDWHTQRGE